VTCIAYKAGVMAADSQSTYGQSRLLTRKLVRLPDGGVAGDCGDAPAGHAGLDWLAKGGSLDGAEEKAFLPNIDGADILVAKGDGTLWLLINRFPAFQLFDKEVAIGCGADAARVAMSLGLSAVEAVRRVAKFDVYCGDPVVSMTVEPPHEYSALVTHPKRSPPAKKKR
jgi:hypothetical protein